MDKEITFIISTDGDVVIDKVTGYGEHCLEATKSIEKALGVIGERKLTDEINDKQTLNQERHLRH
jgi:hypothetical protein